MSQPSGSIVNKEAKGEREICHYGFPLDAFKESHEIVIREKCSGAINELVQDVIQNLTGDSKEAEQKLRAIAENTNRIIEPAVHDLSQKFNACVDKYMAIPNYVAVPDYCLRREDADPKLYSEELEQQLIKQLQEMELVFKQQTVLAANVTKEIESYEELKKDIEIDEGLCEIIENSREDMSMESLKALLNVGKKVKSAAEKL